MKEISQSLPKKKCVQSLEELMLDTDIIKDMEKKNIKYEIRLILKLKVAQFTIELKQEKELEADLLFFFNKYEKKIKRLYLKKRNTTSKLEINPKNLLNKSNSKIILKDIFDDSRSRFTSYDVLSVEFETFFKELTLSDQELSFYYKINELNSNSISDILYKKTSTIESELNNASDYQTNLGHFEERVRNILLVKKDNAQTTNSISASTNEIEFEKESLFLSFKKQVDKNEIKGSIDSFENIILKVLLEKITFNEFGNYVYLYLYDDLKKLKDKLPQIEAKIKENKEINQAGLEYIIKEMGKYYKLIKTYINTPISNKIKEGNKNKEDSIINNRSKEESTMVSSIDTIVDSSTSIDDSTTIDDYSLYLHNDYFNDWEKTPEFLFLIFISARIKEQLEFDMTQNQVFNKNIQPCVSALKLNKNVTKVCFNMNKLGNEGCWALGRVFYYNKTITDLDLSINMLTDDCIRILTIGLNNQSTSLVRLNLSNNNTLTSKCGPYIAKLIENSPSLNHINISKIPLESGINSILLKIIDLIDQENSKLTEFVSYQIKIDSNSLKLFGDLVSHPNCPLKTLVLSDNKFNNEGGKCLIRSLGKNKSMEELILYKCDIGNEMVDDFIYMIRNNNSLVILNLYDNKINDPEKFINLLSYFQAIVEEETQKNGKNDESTQCETQFDPSLTTINEESFELYKNVKRKNNPTSDKPILEQILSSEEENQPLVMTQIKKYYSYFKNFQPSNNKMQHFDLSKNKCKLVVNYNLLKIINNIDLQMLDITQNIEGSYDEAGLKILGEEIINNIKNKSKIIY